MNARCLLVLVCLFAGRSVEADGALKYSEAKMKETLRGVVEKQLEAFRAGDFKKAYSFADPSLQGQMPMEAFETMVKTGYPIIANSSSAEFGLIFDNGEEAVVSVRVTGKDKTSMGYQYLLKRHGEAWAISGVFPVEESSVEA